MPIMSFCGIFLHKAKLFRSFTLISLLITCTACQDSLFDFDKKEEALQLPPPTETGKNTLGCKINGEVWRPGKEFRLMSPPYRGSLEASLNHRTLRFGLSTFRNLNKQTSDAEIWITINDSITTSEKYPLSYVSDTTNYASLNYEKYPGCDFITNGHTSGYMTFSKIDTVNFIVAGQFRFTASDSSCRGKKTITVKKGRFDINYKTH